MVDLLVGTGLAAGAGALGHAWRRALLRRRAAARLGERSPALASRAPAIPEQRTSSALRRHELLPWLLGALLAAVLHLALGVGLLFAATLGIIAGTLGMLLESFLADRRALRLESQLADAIDLVVGSLQAGGGVIQALESAQREAPRPFRDEIDEVVGRIRLGDDPRQVILALAGRVPLETFGLFCTALAVHFEVGGSLAPILATVGRTIRDRIELSRRVRSQAAQAELSVVVMLFLSYFVAAIMWRSNPERMEAFLATGVGAALFAGAMLAQAVGLLVMRRISRIEP